MKPELEEYLFKNFPKLYTELEDNNSFTVCKFECEKGWFRIILWLSRYLHQYIDHQNKAAKKCPDYYQPVSQIKILQIKEKYGTLKFHVEGGNQHTKSIISFVEYISGFVCEFTGKIDNIGFNKNGCIKTTHIDQSNNKDDFIYIDDEELRTLLK